MSGRRAKRERRTTSPYVLPARPIICRCPVSLGPHYETGRCRAMNELYRRWREDPTALFP